LKEILSPQDWYEEGDGIMKEESKNVRNLCFKDKDIHRHPITVSVVGGDF
jgi:hypothetical protein